MPRELIQFETDHFCRLLDPEDTAVDRDDAARLLDSGTATYKTFDPAVDLVLSAVANLGVSLLTVGSSSGLFSVGQRLELLQDNGSFHNTTVATVDATAGTIGIDDVTTVAAAVGQRVRRTFTSGDVSMALFGVPRHQHKGWGYRGVLADTGPHQIMDQDVDCEMILDAGAGIKIKKVECFTVVETCEL